MNGTKIKEAKQALQAGITFAAVSSEGKVYTSPKKGIAPVMEILREKPAFLAGASVADRVIGKAAALLLAKGGICQLYAEVISEHAAGALEYHGIPYTFGKKVPYIINRTGDGMCPMEKTVLEINEVEDAYVALQKKVAELMGR